ncbi:GIY-YIG nuclease family protein [bacterium]|nr:GIY-YIG nuclease family protein [bacterium]
MKKKGIIYKAQNKENGQVYIGATTKTVEERKADHIQKSEVGTGSYFQEAISTFGAEAFSWEQIDTANDVNELAAKEKRYILQYNGQKEGYNGDSGGGIKKKVFQFDPTDRILIAEYDCLQSAANAVSAGKRSISNACLGHNKTCMGYYWSYNSTETFALNTDLRKKAVCQYTLEGVLIAKFQSVSEGSQITGLSKTCIARCCRGEREHSGGFLWKYI